MSADSPPHPTRLVLTTADGVSLEAELAQPDTPPLGVVVAHPHPQFGGDMNNNVVTAIWRAAASAGAAALRFNFRGVGASTGHSSGGADEGADLTAALDHLHRSLPNVPLIIAGYSFGAEIALTTDHPAAAAWFAVAPVFRLFPPDRFESTARDMRRKRLIVAQHDQYAPPAAAREATRGWINTTIEVAASSDHFFAAGTRHVAESFLLLVEELTGVR